MCGSRHMYGLSLLVMSHSYLRPLQHLTSVCSHLSFADNLHADGLHECWYLWYHP